MGIWGTGWQGPDARGHFQFAYRTRSSRVVMCFRALS